VSGESPTYRRSLDVFYFQVKIISVLIFVSAIVIV
jgi:hypothetical protein